MDGLKLPAQQTINEITLSIVKTLRERAAITEDFFFVLKISEREPKYIKQYRVNTEHTTSNKCCIRNEVKTLNSEGKNTHRPDCRRLSSR
jgi:hypothetical protein